MSFYSKIPAFLLALSAMTLAGCVPLHPGSAGNLRRLSKQAVRLDLACQRQSAPKLCGLAAMGMVASYYHLAVHAAQLDGLREEAESTGGISGESLKLVLKDAGYYVAVFPGTLDRQASGLYHHLDLKRPLIVMTGSGARHYLVAVGYDEARALIVLLDPAAGAIATDAGEFMQGWKEANYFTLLAMPN